MRKQNYTKETERIGIFGFFEQSKEFLAKLPKINLNKKTIAIIALVVLFVPLAVFVCTRKSGDAMIAEETGSIHFLGVPIAATSSQRGIISVPTGMAKANPFVPYRDIDKNNKVSDVPEFSLVEPPEMLSENSDAARVMDTIVSGILYDKFSPSAILNIEGNDYLVKKGDVVNNYKVINILQDSVTVKLGANVYKAGIGEILTEGTLNHNNVSNLNNKFGGEKR